MMRRALVAVAAFLMVGAGIAVASHTSQTEQHVVPFTIGDVTGAVTIEDVDELPHETVTVVETVTVTDPTPPPPPPPSPPPPPPPVGGTALTLTDVTWTCTRPVSEYATDGLPLRVTLRYTRNLPIQGLRLGAGCRGDGTPAIDIVMDVQGDGLTHGTMDDAVRVMNSQPGATDLQITGSFNCGDNTQGFHQDGVQVLGGTNITFIGMTSGDENGPTCQGAGGIVFYSGDGNNFDVQGGTFYGCNHALLAGWPTPGAEVRDATFRSGPGPGGAQVCAGYAVSRPCDIRQEWLNAGGQTSGLTCQRWVTGAYRDE